MMIQNLITFQMVTVLIYYLYLQRKLKLNISFIQALLLCGNNKNKIITERTEINPDSIYGISKYIGEMFLKQDLEKTNLKTTIFRIFNTYGPGKI